MKNTEKKVVRLKDTSVRKLFGSVSEANKFIEENSISSATDEIWIEETITTHKYTKVNVVNEFSDDNKLEVIDIIKKAIQTHKIHSHDLIFNLFTGGNFNSKFILLEILKDYFDGRGLGAEDKAKDVFNKILNGDNSVMSDDIFYDNTTFYDFMRDIPFDKPKVLSIVLDHISKTSLNTLEFLSTKTNYKPCNSFGVKINDRIYVSLRPDDIVFSDCTTVGRNISVSGIYQMRGDDIKEMKKYLK
jgi:hypothetical protein